jgi:hypothetical protein
MRGELQEGRVRMRVRGSMGARVRMMVKDED